jgi:hypothetical protein
MGGIFKDLIGFCGSHLRNQPKITPSVFWSKTLFLIHILSQFKKITVMKKLILNAAFCGFASFLFVTSCANEGNKRPVVSIKSSSSGQPTMKIEYSGTIKLNDSQTAFKSISPNGYVNYKKGDKKLVVQSNSEGQLAYEIYAQNTQLALDETGKKVVSEVINDLIANGFKEK